MYANLHPNLLLMFLFTVAQQPLISSPPEVTNNETLHTCYANKTSNLYWTCTQNGMNLTTCFSVLSHLATGDSNPHHYESVLTIPSNCTYDNITLQCCDLKTHTCSVPVLHQSPINCTSSVNTTLAQLQANLPAWPAVLGGTISAVLFCAILSIILTAVLVILAVLRRRKQRQLNVTNTTTEPV